MLFSLLFESKYDQDALLLTRDIVKILTDLYKDKRPIKSTNEYDMDTKAFGPMTLQLEIDMGPNINSTKYVVHGAFHPNKIGKIRVTVEMSTDLFYKSDWNDLIADIRNTINHELEHAAQNKRGTLDDLANYKTPDVDFLHYYLNPIEVEAWMVGIKKQIDYYKKISPDAKLNRYKNVYALLHNQADILYKELLNKGESKEKATKDIATIHSVWLQYLTKRYPELLQQTQSKLLS